ncbi:MAG: RluA family pseudouridine synthase [Oscillospiraceae bacterium]|nr:RluA family pseudouridine synthase [Oscillospiraceae bacterium]
MNNSKSQTGQKKTTNIEFIVEESSGLLEFLLLKLTNKSRNNVKSILTHKEVSVDGRTVTKYDYALKAGQTVSIARPVTRGDKQKNVLDIIYEDNDLLVINKPAGLLSIATEKEKALTAYHLMTEYVQLHNQKKRIFIVHRLDRDTSGVLMFAKNERMKLALQDNWANLVSERGYVAAVEGQLKEKSGRIRTWLLETKTLLMYSSSNEGDGQEAITNYQVINETSGFSLLNIQLETGRKNQIRVHMKELGNPVVGDKKYGAKTDVLKRLGLHANKLAFEHPFTHETMCFEAEMPKSFKALFNKTNGLNNEKNSTASIATAKPTKKTNLIKPINPVTPVNTKTPTNSKENRV